MSSLYKLSAVEYAVLGTANWANLLDLNDLDILEFSSDLKVCFILSYLITTDSVITFLARNVRECV